MSVSINGGSFVNGESGIIHAQVKVQIFFVLHRNLSSFLYFSDICLSNLLKESVNIDVENGNNDGIISAGDNVPLRETVASLETATTISPVETDSNEKAIIIPSVLAGCIVILIIVYALVIRPWLKKRSTTNPKNIYIGNIHCKNSYLETLLFRNIILIWKDGLDVGNGNWILET